MTQSKTFRRERAVANSQGEYLFLCQRERVPRNFRGDPTTAFSSATGFIPFHADPVNRTTALYTNANYTGLDGRSLAYNGKVGIRVNR